MFAPDDGIFHRKNLGNFNLVVTSWGFVFLASGGEICHQKNLGNFNLVVTSWGFVFLTAGGGIFH